MTLTKPLIPALALVLMTVAVPREAEACDPDTCFNAGVLDSLTPVNAALIPSDGVLLLRATGQGQSSEWHKTVTLDVTLDGQPVPGAFEGVGAINEALLWRASEPLAPGVYKATGVVDNPDDLDYCGEDLDLDFEFTVDASPSTMLIPPEVSAAEAVSQTLADDITSLVCCEGVAPTQDFLDCGGSTPLIEYPEGSCGYFEATGVLDVTLDIAPKLPIATVGLLAYSIVIKGETLGVHLSPQIKRSSPTPFCSQVAVTNLATGETAISAELCHGDAVAAQLGAQQLDPTNELTCDGALQTCELDPSESMWDLSKCTPWPPDSETGTPTEGGSSEASGGESGGSEATGTGEGPGETGEKGCACDASTSSGPWSALGVIGLLALRRRRRR